MTEQEAKLPTRLNAEQVRGKAGRRPAAVSEAGWIEQPGRLREEAESLSLRDAGNERGFRRDDREAEGVRLESVCILPGYRGFESLSLRIFPFSVEGQVLRYG
jgi:hypothetical protein